MSHYHNIFKTDLKFNISDYVPYMFNQKYYDSIRPVVNHNEDIIQMKQEVNELQKSVYTPDKRDPLFWCIYIAIHGLAEYEMITHNYTNVIMDEKQKVAEKFYKNPKQMKSVNVKLTNKKIQDIISDMMTNQDMNIDMLYAFSIFYKKKIIIVNCKKYLEIIPDDHDETPIIIDKGVDYSLELEPNIDLIQNHFLIHGFEKPLQCVSKYKVQELKDVGSLFDIDMTKKYDKNTLYNEIVAKIKMELCL